MRRALTSWLPFLVGGLALTAPQPVTAQVTAAARVTAVRAGRLVDPDAGTVSANQVILIERGKFTAIGPGLAIPQGALVIDLSDQTVLPGLVDAHNHLALTYKQAPPRTTSTT